MRALLWIAIGFVLVSWLMRNKKIVGTHSEAPSPSQPSPPPAPSTAQAEQMLQCRHCGTHIPASEAIVHASGSVFCSEEHQRLNFPF